MRHQKRTIKLNLASGQRSCLLNTLVKQLVTHERIETTEAKASALIRMAEKIVTIGKKDSLHARRQAYRVLQNRVLVKKLFDDIAPRFATRHGGYCRMLYKKFRVGDGARTAIVEFVVGGKKAETAPETTAAKSEAPAAGKTQKK